MARLGPICSIAVALACCGGRPAPPAAVPAAYRGGKPALSASSALAYLPQSTTLVLVAGDPSALDRATGWAGLTLDGRPHLPDLTELASAGLATAKPAGLALIDPVHETWVAFATIADRKLLANWIATRARGDGGTTRPSQAGDAIIYLPDDDAGRAVVLRGDQALFLWTRGAKSTRDLAAVRLAALARADSILETDDYRRLVPRLGYGRDLAAFLSSAWLAAGDTSDLDKAMLLQERVAGALQAARAQKSQAGHIATLERQLALVRRIAASAGKAERFRVDLGRQLGPLALGVELRDDELRVAIVAAPATDSAVARLLPGTQGPHPLATAITEPAFLVSAHLQPAALVELISGWLESRGSSMRRLRDAATRIGVDLDRGLLSNLKGELTFAISGGPASALDVTIGLEVQDSKRAQALVTQLAHSPAGRAEGSAAIVDAAGLSAPLRILVAGDYLIASTAASMAREPAQDPSPGAAARLILAGWMALGGNPAAPPPPRLVTLAPDGHPAPPSDEFLGLRGKLDVERARADTLAHEHELASAKHLRELGKIAGQLELTVERDGELYRAFGRLASGGLGVSTVARKLSDARRQNARAATRREDQLAESSSRIDALQRELDRLRKRDVAAWEKTRPPR